MLSAEALERNEGMRKEKGCGAWKNCCVLHLRKCLETWGLVGFCQHPSSKPGAGGRADLDGWRSPGQGTSQCWAHKAQIFPPAPRAARGKAKSLRPVPLSPWWRWQFFRNGWGQINKCFSVVLLSLGKLKVEMPPEECAPGMSITGSML